MTTPHPAIAASLPVLPAGTTPPHVQMLGIVKHFGQTAALRGVDLAVMPGEVHALVGENGAGKSTLMHILAGMFPPDGGEILLHGIPTALKDVEAAYAHGVAMVHQHFMLLPSLTVAENLTLGREPRRNGLFDRRAAEQAVLALGERYDLRVDPAARVADLSLGDLQRVEILRALYRGADLLILDEPTGVLTPQEAQGLFRVIRELRADGKTTLFISHKLDEVLEITDSITVLRDGQVAGTRSTAETDAAELARLMVGREVSLHFPRSAQPPGKPVLELNGVYGRGVHDVSFTVREREIVGLAGVAGNGQSELADLIAGLRPLSAGTIQIAGQNATRATVAERRAFGLANIPEDRYRHGLAAAGNLSENLLITQADRAPFARRGLLRWRAIRAWAGRLIARFGVRAGDLGTGTRAGALSGGNAQRVVIARELADDAPFVKPLIMAAQPTRGVDIAASEFVRGVLIQRRDAGAGVLLISADLSEIRQCSDRILVMAAGKIVGELRADEADDTRLGLLMAGIANSTPDSTASGSKAGIEIG